MKNFIKKHEEKIQRLIEIVPGALTWAFITAPIWAGIFFPQFLAYTLIFFALYWFLQSARVGRGIIRSYPRIKKDTRRNWVQDSRKFKDFSKVHHLVIIPNYKEPFPLLEETLEKLSHQTFPKERIHIILAMEKREGEEARKKARYLVEKFKGGFGHLWTTFHPEIPKETIGKSSNMAWAGKWGKKKLVDEMGLDQKNILVTTNDADAHLHPRYLACITYKFLSLPQEERYYRFFQSPIVFYNNIWRVPFPVRICSAAASIIWTARLSSPLDIHPVSTYTASLKTIHEAGYWGTKVVPEDYHIFYKCFFAHQGNVEVEPVFLPCSVDAAESTSFWKGLLNYYRQVRRWAYGVSDDPYVFKNALLHSEIPRGQRLFRLLLLTDFHFLWAVKSYIPFSFALVPLVNPSFQNTLLCWNTSRIVGLLFKLCLLFTAILILADRLLRPQPRKGGGGMFFSCLFDWLLAPTAGLFFSVLPAIDAYTRLMLGKYLEYKVTEKIAP